MRITKEGRLDKRSLQFVIKMNVEGVAYLLERLYGYNFYKYFSREADA